MSLISSFLPGNKMDLPGLSANGDILSLMGLKPQYIVKSIAGNVEFKSMLEMSVEESTELPTEPIEQGSFANYNRIVEPIQITCRLAQEGTPAKLQAMLNQLTELKKGTIKVTFIAPMASYDNLMLESFDWRRDDHSGHNVLTVDLRLKEIREIEGQKTVTAVTEPPPVSAGSTADGSCASSEDCGEVQPQSTSDSEDENAGGGRRRSILKDILG